MLGWYGQAQPTKAYLDARSGKVRWHVPAAVSINVEPVFTAASVISIEGGTAAQVQTQVVARDLRTGEEAWHVDVQQGLAALALRGSLVVVTESGAPGDARAVAIDAASGKTEWTAKLARFSQRAPVILADGGIVVQEADPHFACLT